MSGDWKKESKSWDSSSEEKKSNKWSAAKKPEWNKDDKSRVEWPSKKYSKDSKSWSNDKRKSGKWDKSSEKKTEWKKDYQSHSKSWSDSKNSKDYKYRSS